VSLIFVLVLSPGWAAGEDLDALIAEADSLFAARNLDSAISLAELAVQRAEMKYGAQDTAFATVLRTAGSYNYAAGNYDRAQTRYQRALTIRREQPVPDSAAIARELRSIGVIYYQRAQYPQAESTYFQSIAVWEQALNPDHVEVAKTLGNLAMVYVEQGKAEKALPLLNRAQAIKEAELGPNHSEIARGLNQLAAVYAGISDYEQSERLYRRALHIREAAGEQDVGLLASLNNLANVLKEQARYVEAEQMLRRALDVSISSFGPEHRYTGSVLSNLASVLKQQTNYADAEKVYLRALNITETNLGPDHPYCASILVSLANLMRTTGRFHASESLYTRSLDIREQSLGKNHPDVASSLRGLATACRLRGKYAEAEPLYQRAISICREALGDRHPHVADAMLGLANFRFKQGQYSEAESLYRQALDIYRGAFEPIHPEIALVYQNLANLMHENGRQQKAVELYRKALSISDSTSGREHPETALILGNLGEALIALGRIAEADTVLSEALAIQRQLLGRNHRIVDKGLSGLAKVRSCQNRLAEAKSLLVQAEAALAESLGSDHPEIASVRRDRATVLARSGKFNDAMKLYRSSLQLKHRFIDYAFSFSSQEQKLRWLSKYPLLDNQVLTLAAVDSNDVAPELAAWMILNGKAAVADAMIAEDRTMICSDQPAIRSAALLRSELGTRLANLSLAAVSEAFSEDYDDTLASLTHRIDSVEAYLSRQCSEFIVQGQQRRVRVSDAIEKLAPGTALWEFIRFNTTDHSATCGFPMPLDTARYLGLVLTHSGNISAVDLGPAASIDSLVHLARNRIGQTGAGALSASGAHLERRLRSLLKPLSDRVFVPMVEATGEVTDIYVSPDGSLNLLPLQILPLPNGSYVIEDYSISYLSAGRDLVTGRDGSARVGKTALLVADPDFESPASAPGVSSDELQMLTYRSDGSPRPVSNVAKCLDASFPRLSQSRNEMETASAILEREGFTVNRLHGPEAAESALKTLEAAPRLLHISTHGYYCTNESNTAARHIYESLTGSGLALAGANQSRVATSRDGTADDDGLLTAIEVASLDLRGTELAVLSACQTGLGEVVSGEGVFGLRRAFQRAGARSLLVSLWRAPDRETRQLIGSFYQHWLSGADLGTALRLAALEVIEQSRMRRGSAHPLLWGGFILAGNR
jgi:tetratricopeptide (TPR) repeat protein/CHAT domain-containing protein